MPSGEGSLGSNALTHSVSERRPPPAAVQSQETVILVKPFFGWVAFAALASVAPAPLGAVFFLCLTLYVFLGPTQVIKGLTVLAFIVLANGYIEVPGRTTFRWVVLFASFLRAAADTVGPPTGQQNVPRAVAVVTGFAGIVAIVSTFISPMPSISILKITSFWISAVSLVVAFHRATPTAAYWRSWMITFAAFFVSASIVFYFLGLGYQRVDDLFQGVFSHPQILGPVSGVMLALVMGTYFEGDLRARVALPLGLGLAALVYLSGARTGALALGGGLMVAIVLGVFAKTDSQKGKSFLARPVNMLLITVMLAGSALYAQSVEAVLSEFVMKDDDTADMVTVFVESRGELIDRSMANFYEHPWLGIGFGMPSDLTGFERSITYVSGVPVAAKIEKGFMPTAVLEEVGLIGAFFVVSLLVSLAWMPIRYGGFTTRWVVAAALLLNVGEAILFSLGGTGLFMWLMLTYGHGQGKRAFQARHTRRADVPAGGEIERLRSSGMAGLSRGVPPS